MIKIYGIKNCDTVKKALGWLKGNGLPCELHDYKDSGISKEKLEEWLLQQPLEKLLNKKSTAWRELSPAQQLKAGSKAGALKLMQEHHNLIKRPVIETPGAILVGYDAAAYKKHFAK